MQSVSSRIWTRIVASNSYDDNQYTTGTSGRSGYCENIFTAITPKFTVAWKSQIDLFADYFSMNVIP